MREILDSLPLGVALDAACGTGRHTACLVSLGHKVIGVDTSPEVLTLAREKVPQLSSDYDNSASLPRWAGIDCQGASHDAA